MLRKTVARAALGAGFGLLAAAAARADGPPVSFSLSVGNAPPVYAPAPVVVAPPPLVVAAPSMVWLPEIGAYVAVGLQQPIFYIGGVYYYRYGPGWYVGPSYGGPWRAAGPPPGRLRHFDERDWGHYQRMAREHEGQPHWRQFRAGPEHGPGRGGPPGWERGGGGGGDERGGPPGRGRGHDR